MARYRLLLFCPNYTLEGKLRAVLLYVLFIGLLNLIVWCLLTIGYNTGKRANVVKPCAPVLVPEPVSYAREKPQTLYTF